MEREELGTLIESHRKWLNNEPDGKKLVLRDVNLYGVDLRHADLRGAELHNVGLHYATLRYVNLHSASLSHIDLSYADLNKADLSYADLSQSNLSHADLSHANLNSTDLSYNVDLSYAKLHYTDLSYANLRHVNLSRAVLYSTNLHCTNLHETNLQGTSLEYSNLFDADIDDPEHYRLGVILKESMTGWKKCRDGKIVKLSIPSGSVVFCINGKKYRSNRAKVISVNGSNKETAISLYNKNFIYVPNKTLKVDDFDLRYNVECSSGIHFFRTKEEAENY